MSFLARRNAEVARVFFATAVRDAFTRDVDREQASPFISTAIRQATLAFEEHRERKSLGLIGPAERDFEANNVELLNDLRLCGGLPPVLFLHSDEPCCD